MSAYRRACQKTTPDRATCTTPIGQHQTFSRTVRKTDTTPKRTAAASQGFKRALPGGRSELQLQAHEHGARGQRVVVGSAGEGLGAARVARQVQVAVAARVLPAVEEVRHLHAEPRLPGLD